MSIRRVELYWDTQDPAYIGWAWREITDDCSGDSGAFGDSLDEFAKDEAVIQAFKEEIGEATNIPIIVLH